MTVLFKAKIILVICFISVSYCACSDSENSALPIASQSTVVPSQNISSTSSSENTGCSSQYTSSSMPSNKESKPHDVYPDEWGFTNGTRTMHNQSLKIGDTFMDWKLVDLYGGTDDYILATFEGEVKTKGIIVCENRYPFGYCFIFYPDDNSIFPRSQNDDREGDIFFILREKSTYDKYGTNCISEYLPYDFFQIEQQEQCRFDCEIVLSIYKVYNKPSAVADIGIVSSIVSQGEKQSLVELDF